MGDDSTSADVSLLAPLGLMPAGPVFGLSSVTYPVLVEPEYSNETRYDHDLRRVTLDASAPRLKVRKQISEARDASLRELLRRVAEAGMDGVLSVQFDCQVLLQTPSTWGVSFRAFGQGVRSVSGGEAREVFSAACSAAEWLLLSEHGLLPVHVVMSSEPTAYKRELAGQNSSELRGLSHATTHARSRAVAELQRRARTLRADGVLGIELEMIGGEWIAPSHEHLVFGTAVRRIKPSRILSDERTPVQMILSLETGDCSA
ncbi:hypothetical protein Q0M94_21835 (plasmid) [Deinococcus radiomollis]|uniref:hypothetical protein n=1 Tax=Deinococcus radiomollis TaxID=468916 RepID=UPI003892C8A6